MDSRHDRPGGELIGELGEIGAGIAGDALADSPTQVGEPVRQRAESARQKRVRPVRRDDGIEHQAGDVRWVRERVSECLLRSVGSAEDGDLVDAEAAADRVHVVCVVERRVEGASGTELPSQAPITAAVFSGPESSTARRPGQAIRPDRAVPRSSYAIRVYPGKSVCQPCRCREGRTSRRRLSRPAGDDEHHLVRAHSRSGQLLDVQTHGSASPARRIERDGERPAEHGGNRSRTASATASRRPRPSHGPPRLRTPPARPPRARASLHRQYQWDLSRRARGGLSGARGRARPCRHLMGYTPL